MQQRFLNSSFLNIFLQPSTSDLILNPRPLQKPAEDFSLQPYSTRKVSVSGLSQTWPVQFTYFRMKFDTLKSLQVS